MVFKFSLLQFLTIKDLKSSPALLSFLSLDTCSYEQNCLEESMVWLMEAVKDLNDQLKRREHLGMELKYQKSLVIVFCC